MDVVFASVADAVTHAGGLICDRSLTGWDVGVFALGGHPDSEHDLALRIIGARRTEHMPQEPAADTLLRAVVVSGDLYRDDEDVRRWVEDAMSEPRVEILVWDSARPASDVRRVEMPVSRAATVFLGHALAALGRHPESRSSEAYCQLRTGRLRQALRRQNVLTTVNGG